MRSSLLRRRVLVPVALVSVGLAGVGGYLIGVEAAPTQADAERAKDEGYAESHEQTFAAASASAEVRGLAAGRAAGRKAGRSDGAESGALDGGGGAQTTLAELEAAERARNCGAPLFVDGYCPTDEEIAQENQAEALCGPGDRDEEAARLGIQC